MSVSAFLKTAITIVLGLIFSELSAMLFKFLGVGTQLMHVWRHAASGVNVVLTAEPASSTGFAAHLDVVFSAGIAAASFSIVAGGLVLGIKACWSSLSIETEPKYDVVMEDHAEGRALSPCYDVVVNLEEREGLYFEARPAPILHQANADKRHASFCGLDTENQESMCNIQVPECKQALYLK